MLKALFTFVILSLSQIVFSAPVNVTEHGVLPDSSLNATLKIQHLIDSLHLAGGGILNFPPGNYKSSTIILKSNVGLHLEQGATLWASLQEKDYENDIGTPVLIYASEANNISITGQGCINGRARRVYEPLKKVDDFIKNETETARLAGVEMKMYYKLKPYTCMIFLESCQDIHIRDVSLIESTSWTLHVKWCERVRVEGIYLSSSLEKGVNADGIDIDGCCNVMVSNCIIETGDDAIVLKSTRTGDKFQACENVTVSSCLLVSTSSALKLGTESHGDFRHIIFSNCIIRNSNRGLSIVVRDGANVENIQFSNITMELTRKHFNWWGNGDPIWLVVKKRHPESAVGSIRNVTFQNIIAKGQGTCKIEGYPDLGQIRNIRMYNVHITMESEDLPDKRASSIFQVNDASEIYMDGCSFNWDPDRGIEDKWDVPLSLKNVNGMTIRDTRLDPKPGSEYQLRIINVQGLDLGPRKPAIIEENN